MYFSDLRTVWLIGIPGNLTSLIQGVPEGRECMNVRHGFSAHICIHSVIKKVTIQGIPKVKTFVDLDYINITYTVDYSTER